jgi:hypothetical protein
MVCSIDGGGERSSLSECASMGLSFRAKDGGSSSKLAMEDSGEEDADDILAARAFVYCRGSLRREVALDGVQERDEAVWVARTLTTRLFRLPVLEEGNGKEGLY